MPAVEKIGRIPPAGTGASPALAPGGETAGRRASPLAAAPAGRLPETATTTWPGTRPPRLSAYLRFGCVSPLEVAVGARDRPGGEEFCRQLAWRDFFYQVTAAFQDMARKDYRPGPAWHEDARALEAWRAGRTGIPIVDAGCASWPRRASCTTGRG